MMRYGFPRNPTPPAGLKSTCVVHRTFSLRIWPGLIKSLTYKSRQYLRLMGMRPEPSPLDMVVDDQPAGPDAYYPTFNIQTELIHFAVSSRLSCRSGHDVTSSWVALPFAAENVACRVHLCHDPGLLGRGRIQE